MLERCRGRELVEVLLTDDRLDLERLLELLAQLLLGLAHAVDRLRPDGVGRFLVERLVGLLAHLLDEASTVSAASWCLLISVAEDRDSGDDRDPHGPA
jgi:hypothetical protein